MTIGNTMKWNLRAQASKRRFSLAARLIVSIAGDGIALAAYVAEADPSPVALAVPEPATAGGPVTLRRLNESQYKNSIAAIFGPDIKVPGRFEPPLREDGLLAIGDGRAVVSASGFEQYELRAREISAQVLAEDKRKTYLSCTPKTASSFDKALCD